LKSIAIRTAGRQEKETKMRIRCVTAKHRKVWEIDNGALTLRIQQGGGNLSSLVLRERPDVNPYWDPPWATIEPWQYAPRHANVYGDKLLACIAGHNVCLGWFGDPSPAEAAAGMGVHGEAPVARWRLLRQHATDRALSLTCGCELPVAGMTLRRTFATRQGSRIVRVKETIRNTTRRDLPFTMCQHVTLGPPFLAKDVTVFDMPAGAGHTFPGAFGDPQRLESDAAFVWPSGPGADGEVVNLRTLGKAWRRSGDFSTQLIDPNRDDAWFAVVNPRLGVLLAYVWRRADFPWVGNWEENHARRDAPWGGRTLTRGMEFANTPFPVSLRQAVETATFQGQRTFRWLPAREKLTIEYAIVTLPVPGTVTGVCDIRRTARGFDVAMVE
jgi:hypothetical protein